MTQDTRQEPDQMKIAVNILQKKQQCLESGVPRSAGYLTKTNEHLVLTSSMYPSRICSVIYSCSIFNNNLENKILSIRLISMFLIITFATI